MRRARLAVLLPLLATTASITPPAAGPQFAVSFPNVRSADALDGRLLLMVSNNESAEPRFQINDGANTQILFGVDVAGLAPGAHAIIDANVL